MRHIRRETHAVAFLEDLPGRHRLAIDADKEVARPAVGNLLGEELLDGRAIGNLDVVGETCAIVIDEEDDHAVPLLWK